MFGISNKNLSYFFIVRGGERLFGEIDLLAGVGLAVQEERLGTRP